MNRDYFFTPFGPTTTECNDPMFLLQRGYCWWSGQSWPFATTQTLKAMANVLHNSEQQHITRDDYLKLLHILPSPIAKRVNPILLKRCTRRQVRGMRTTCTIAGRTPSHFPRSRPVNCASSLLTKATLAAARRRLRFGASKRSGFAITQASWRAAFLAAGS